MIDTEDQVHNHCAILPPPPTPCPTIVLEEASNVARTPIWGHTNQLSGPAWMGLPVNQSVKQRPNPCYWLSDHPHSVITYQKRPKWAKACNLSKTLKAASSKAGTSTGSFPAKSFWMLTRGYTNALAPVDSAHVCSLTTSWNHIRSFRVSQGPSPTALGEKP